jgi:hypothetical protein
MQTVSLSFQTPDYSKMEATPIGGTAKKMPMKECYPSLCIPGNETLAKSLKAGQEFEAVVKFRVRAVMIEDRDGKSKNDYPSEYNGTRVELEAQSLMPKGISMQNGGGTFDDESGEDAIRSFFTKKTNLAGAQAAGIA